MIIDNVFPMPFAVDRLDINQEDFNFILNYISDINNLKQNGLGNLTTLSGCFLENTPNLKKQIESSLKEFTDKTINEVDELVITQSWINVNPPGTCHDTHAHRNSILSGVFYIQTDYNSGKFNIVRPEGNYTSTVVRGKINDYNEFNYEYMFYLPRPNDLFLFPSKLPHSVDENKSDIYRISLSFNTFYKVPFGDLDSKAGVIFP